jgi:folate-binding protein YgfZ
LGNLKTQYPKQYATPLAVIEITGDDRKTFLQGQFSCNLDTLEPGGVLPGLYCNRQGRIIANFYILERDDHYLLLLDTSLVTPIIEQLKHYGLFSKVEFNPLQTIVSFALTDDTSIATHFSENEQHEIRLCCPGYELILQADDGGSETVDNLWHFANILNLQVQLTADSSEKFLPHRLGYQDTGHISFNKGCYLGQEIIARMHYKSEHKHHLAHIETDSDAESMHPGAKLKTTDSADTLEVVQAARFNNKTHALVSVNKEAPRETQAALQDAVITLSWLANG